MFQVISVFEPRTPGKVTCRGTAILTKPCYMKAEDYNSETQKSYLQAEGVVNAGFKFNFSVILDSNKSPMIVGSILPPFAIGREIATDAIKQLNERAANAA